MRGTLTPIKDRDRASRVTPCEYASDASFTFNDPITISALVRALEAF